MAKQIYLIYIKDWRKWIKIENIFVFYYYEIMKIYLATGNKNKKREMQELLSEHTILIPSDEGISFDPDETGTFPFSSLLKLIFASPFP